MILLGKDAVVRHPKTQHGTEHHQCWQQQVEVLPEQGGTHKPGCQVCQDYKDCAEEHLDQNADWISNNIQKPPAARFECSSVFVQIIHLRPNSVHCFMWWICNPLQNACNTNHTLHLQKNSRRNKKNSPCYVVQEIVAMTRQMQMHNKVTEFGETNCSFQRLDPLEHDY